MKYLVIATLMYLTYSHIDEINDVFTKASTKLRPTKEKALETIETKAQSLQSKAVKNLDSLFNIK